MNARFALSLLLPAALVVGGCDETSSLGPGEAPTVTVLASAVNAGGAVPLRLHNPTQFAWAYDVCPARFQRLLNAKWMDVPPALIVCIAVVPLVFPGEAVQVSAQLVSEAEPGLYRALVPFESNGVVVERTSDAFTVEALPIGDAPFVTVLEASAPRGGEVTVRLANPTANRFGFNLCSDGRLQRQEGVEWVDVGDPLWLCTAALYSLDPAAVKDETYPILPDLATGTYRLRVKLWFEMDEMVVRYSGNFIVN